jgi:cytochrome c553
MAGVVEVTGWSAFVAVAIALSAGPVWASGDRALGEYLSSECVTCHQTSGRRGDGIPAITGHPGDQFIALMETYKQRQRENPVMQAIAARLSAEEIAALAAYYGSLKPAQ